MATGPYICSRRGLAAPMGDVGRDAAREARAPAEGPATPTGSPEGVTMTGRRASGHSFVSKYGTVDPALSVSGRCVTCGETADSHDG